MAPVSKKFTSKQRWEARKKKRREIERSYREHTPPQVRHGRWLTRVKGTAFHPSTRPSEACPHCGTVFGVAFKRGQVDWLTEHIIRKHPGEPH